MNNKIKVVDNYLSKENYEKVKNIVDSPLFAWYFSSKVATLEDKKGFYFYHILFDKNQIFSDFFKSVSCLWETLNARALLRVKANLYTATNKLITHTPHRDYPFSNKGMVFSINNCDGYTEIEGKKVKSIANRAVFFNAGKFHSSTTCTDTEVRKNININYL